MNIPTVKILWVEYLYKPIPGIFHLFYLVLMPGNNVSGQKSNQCSPSDKLFFFFSFSISLLGDIKNTKDRARSKSFVLNSGQRAWLGERFHANGGRITMRKVRAPRFFPDGRLKLPPSNLQIPSGSSTDGNALVRLAQRI